MEDKNSEMSLDEVLSSIKKMVIDDEPPVLELTDMISEDGSIVKIKNNSKGCKNQQDMGSFLKLIQKNQDSSENIDRTDNSSQQHKQKGAQINREKHDVLSAIIKEVLPPILQKWMNDNLPKIVNNIVEVEVKNFLYQKSDKLF